MNAFPLNPEQMPKRAANSERADAESPLGVRMLERTQELFKAQDSRIASDLEANANSRSQTAQMLSLLQLQYDLDDMQVSATMAKNVADKVSQALTTLTQRT
jgi:hypothetical protein